MAGGKSMDELLRRLAFEHECREAARRLAETDPGAWAEYENEQATLAEGSYDPVTE